MTSIGIVVGAATIVLVIGIGKGGQMDVAEQFAELNAGAIDVSYEYEGEEERSGGGGFSFGNIGRMFGNFFGGGASAGGSLGGSSGNFNPGSGFDPGSGGGFDSGSGFDPGSGGGFDSGSGFNPGSSEDFDPGNRGDAEMNGTNKNNENRFPAAEEAEAIQNSGQEASEEQESETSAIEDRLNQEQVLLTEEDVEDIEWYVSGISGAVISYSTKTSVEGGNLTSAQTYTIAGVKENFMEVSRLELTDGEFLTEDEDESCERVCVLGASAAKELFGTAADALEQTIYIDDRTYTVTGILKSSQTVVSGISPDTSILIPYETGIKYITGTEIDPVITVIAENVDVLDTVIEDVRTVLEERHQNTRFTFEDSGSKMEAARSSNKTLTLLLSAMAAIVFLVGGIGIMNVLFVSVRERTNEIGILKVIGTPRKNILLEFLLESAAISLIGGMLGIGISFLAIPLAEWMDVRVESGVTACLTALGFAVLTGTVFGIYPAWKASRLEPVDALNAE